MAKYIVTYEIELESGDIPPQAVAEALLLLEKNKSDYSTWELSNPQIIDVRVAE